MKRKLYVLLIVVTIIASIGLMTACSGDKTATDITSIENAKLSGVGENIYNEIVNIGTNYADRSFGNEGEKKFVLYLTSELSKLGYENHNDTFTFTNAMQNKETCETTNVIFKKDNPRSDKFVLITSSVDNAKKYEEYGSDGIYAGATGVAIMLELARSLKDVDLPYDVYFVGYGANQYSWLGASHFFDDFYRPHNHAKKDTLLMIDLSKPIGGDHMYMYSDEMDTIHGDYFYDVASENRLDFRAVPRDKQPVTAMILENQPMPYIHLGNTSSNILYITGRIPSLNFVSANWETWSTGNVIERKGHTNIENTNRDTLEVFVDLVGKDRIVGEADMVHTVIMKAMTRPNFVDTMEKSAASLPNYKMLSNNGLLIGLRVGIMALLIILAVVLSSKARKTLPMNSMEQFMTDMGFTKVPNPQQDPFGSDVNDPFQEVEREFNSKDSDNTNNNDNNADNGDNKEEKKDKTDKPKDASDDIFGI